MKDIMLKITGRQMADKDDEDLMEFITEGKLYERGGSRYLIYDESEFSGFPGCKTTLKSATRHAVVLCQRTIPAATKRLGSQ